MTYNDFFQEWNGGADFIKCHTSGSTGKPTEILLPRSLMEESARRTCSYFGIDSTSTLYSCIAPDYIGGKMMAVRSLVSGAAFRYEIPSNRPLSLHDGSPIDLISVVPSQMLHFIENPEIAQCVRRFLIGGSPIPPLLRQRIIDSGIKAFESYGMTETASHIAIREIKDGEEGFTPLPGIKIFPHNGNLLGIRLDVSTQILTNDVAEIMPDGKFRIIGRADNAIITGGKKVFPEEIERKLSYKFNFPFYISSLPDTKWGERVVLVTIFSAPQDSLILDFAKSTLLSEEVPKEIVRMDALPLTQNGKIKRIRPY